SVFRHPGDRPRGDPGGRAQRLSDHQGRHDLRRGRHHGRQPGGGSSVQGDRPAGAAQMKETGVWMLAWRRFKRVRLGVASLVVVVVYAVMMLASAAGLIVRDWGEEAAVNFAPPTFLGPEPESPQLAKMAQGAQPGSDYGIADPLGPDLADI